MLAHSPLATAGFVLGLLAGIPAAQAFRLVPIEIEFAPSGRGATQIVRVENDRSDPAAIEIRMMGREMTADGEDRLTPADDSFVVHPAQIVLMPGQGQSVRVQWAGPSAPDRELPFRLVAEQLPVDLGAAPPQGGQVRLLVRYVASVYVAPQGARPDVQVARANSAPGGMLELVLVNRGTAHRILREPVLTVSGGGRSVTLQGEALKGLGGENILAGVERRFLLPWPGGLPQGAITASLNLAP
ncbi:fimbrial biogenesis chaperone [Arenibaculum pallidiluteum]|uniref:fimbrial biogenesis chaperone n=1 Tax=Arenibaculum pallidiluteum TaxID=2812559 RepID=UPI001A970D84|nr:fimbria/pilus periplasmic chaperone [Arenibaculum pallidiluteum]